MTVDMESVNMTGHDTVIKLREAMLAAIAELAKLPSIAFTARKAILTLQKALEETE